MTEKAGGSDVADGCDTYAVKMDHNDDLYTPHGYKWFSSATDSDMTLTLARLVHEEDGSYVGGTKGISMFYLKTREAGRLNNIQVELLFSGVLS